MCGVHARVCAYECVCVHGIYMCVCGVLNMCVNVCGVYVCMHGVCEHGRQDRTGGLDSVRMCVGGV